MGSEELRAVAQMAIVVKDIEKARSNWAELLGVEGPPISETETRESTHMIFRGKPSNGRAKLCFFKLSNLVLELIQPVGGPSTWQNFLEESGEGIHHLAFRVENLDETLGKLREMGIGMEQRGEFKGGGYVYTDSRSSLGAIMEILYHKE